MKVRIESDGTGLNTQVRNHDTGEVIKNVVSAKWEIAGGDKESIASLELQLVSAKIAGVAKFYCDFQVELIAGFIRRGAKMNLDETTAKAIADSITENFIGVEVKEHD